MQKPCFKDEALYKKGEKNSLIIYGLLKTYYMHPLKGVFFSVKITSKKVEKMY